MSPRRAVLITIGSFLLVLAGCPSSPGRPEDPQVPACVEHAVFGPPEESPYVLPYPVGSAYKVFQTYCGPLSHGKDGQMSIDFLMPMGAVVVAARAGVVRRVIDEHADYGSEFNAIWIEHDDGTAAFYGHLEERTSRVRVGDRVVPGQVIALCGASGTELAHLHFGVSRSWPPRAPDDVPVNFRNCDGPLDGRGGLQRDVRYRALPYEPSP